MLFGLEDFISDEDIRSGFSLHDYGVIYQKLTRMQKSVNSSVGSKLFNNFTHKINILINFKSVYKTVTIQYVTYSDYECDLNYVTEKVKGLSLVDTINFYENYVASGETGKPYPEEYLPEPWVVVFSGKTKDLDLNAITHQITKLIIQQEED